MRKQRYIRSRKKKVSCAFCASSNGDKLPVLILIPRKRPLKDFAPPDNVLVVYNGNKKTFDSDTINSCFIQRVIGPHVLRHNHEKSLLYIDIVIKNGQLKQN